jgi:hypothetical protein
MISITTKFRAGFRFCSEAISECFLQDIMGSLTNDSIGRIFEFIPVPDHTKHIKAYGFGVELDGEIAIVT